MYFCLNIKSGAKLLFYKELQVTKFKKIDYHS